MGKKERLLSPGSSPECYGMGSGGSQEKDVLCLSQSVPGLLGWFLAPPPDHPSVPVPPTQARVPSPSTHSQE